MLTISPVNFKADIQQSSSMFNQNRIPPQMPNDYGYDILDLQTVPAKKENSKEKWQKAGVIAQCGLATAFLGLLVMEMVKYRFNKKLAKVQEEQFKRQMSELADKPAKTVQNINFKDVSGEKSFEELFLSDEMEKVVDDLKTSIERAEWLKKKGSCGGSGIMLYGEPGGGKNAYVYALTKYLQELFPGSKLIMMDVLKFKGMFNGQTENNIIGFVENVVNEAKANPNKRYVVFLDEFDSIARKDTSSNSSMTESFQNAFKTKLLDLTNVENIQVIAATNKAEKGMPLNRLLDDAILNRFPTKINVPLPTKKQMIQAVVGHYKTLPKEFVDSKLLDVNNPELNRICEYIVKDDHHASFRDYNYILEKARLLSEAKNRTPGSPITIQDFENAVIRHSENENWDTGFAA